MTLIGNPIILPPMSNGHSTIVSMYRDQHLAGPAIVKATGVSSSQVYRILRKAGVTKSSSEASRIYTVDVSYFTVVDTSEKAQILGFWYADGCVRNETQCVLQIALAAQDEPYLDLLRKCLGYTGPIHHRPRSSPNAQDVCVLSITQDQLVADLIRLGCVPRKTFVLKFPTPDQVPPQFLSSFMLGYFEGDGCLYIARPTDDGMHRIVGDAEFSITSTWEMCEGYGETLKRECGVTYKIVKRHKTRENNNYTLKVLGNQQIIKVMRFLYSGNTFRMERKWEKYQELLELVAQYKSVIDAERNAMRQSALCRKRSNHVGPIYYLRSLADNRVYEIRGTRRFQEMVGIGYDSLKRVLAGSTHHAIWQPVAETEVAIAREVGIIDKTHSA